MESFISAVSDGGEPITTGRSARWALEVINGIVLSGIRKEAVPIPVDRARYDELMEGLTSGKTQVYRPS